MDADSNWRSGSAFATPLIEQVREGMTVVDRAGARVGEVSLVQMGDPEAVTTAGNDYEVPGLVRDVVRSVVGAEPDVPEPLRSRLRRYGFLKVDGPGLMDADRYVRADRIAGITGDTVRLSVTRDQLAEES